MSEEIKDEESLSTENNEENKAVETEGTKGQVKALLTLVPVLGVLWAIVHFLPQFTDWTEKKMEDFNASEPDQEIVTSAEKPEEVGSQDSATAKPAPVDEGGAVAGGSPTLTFDLKAHLEKQLLEQLGGPEKVEVRHIALTEDEVRMVAAIKMLAEESGSSQGGLREIYFERDEFGRYVPNEASDLPGDLKLWSE